MDLIKAVIIPVYLKCNNKWYEYNDMKNKSKLIGQLSDVYKNPNYSSNIVGLFYSKI